MLARVKKARIYKGFGISLYGQFYIERFWKFTKSRLRTKYYTDFNEFSSRIDAITDSSDGVHKKEVDKPITEKVQLFDSSHSGKEKLTPIMCVQNSIGLAA